MSSCSRSSSCECNGAVSAVSAVFFQWCSGAVEKGEGKRGEGGCKEIWEGGRAGGGVFS